MESTNALFCRWAGCNLYFADSESLLNHCTNDHVGRKITNNLCLDCHWDGCDVKTSKRDHITSHLRVHIAHKPYICNKCSKSFKRPQDLKKHEKLHNDSEETYNNTITPQFQNNPTTAFVPEYLSVYNNDSFNNSRRELSPQSASSDMLATTPPSGVMYNPNNPQYNQLFTGIYNKQLSPDYNENMAHMLRTMSTSNPQELAASVSSEMDINSFNNFMGQLHGNIVPEAPPLFTNSMATPMQTSFVDPNFNFSSADPNSCLPSDNFGYNNMNQMNYQQGFAFDQSQSPVYNTMPMNCNMTPQPQHNNSFQQQNNSFQQQQNNSFQQQQHNSFQQQQQQNNSFQQQNNSFQQQNNSFQVQNNSFQPQTPMAYPSLDFEPDSSTYQQANEIFQSMLGPKIQVSQDGSTFIAPQVDYNNFNQYASVSVTPQRSEPRPIESKSTEEEAKKSDAKDTTNISSSETKADSKENSSKAGSIPSLASSEDNSEPSITTDTNASAGLDALSKQLGSLELTSSKDSLSSTNSEPETKPTSVDQKRLQDAALIRSLVVQVNQLYRSLKTTPAAPSKPKDLPSTSLPAKDVFPAYAPTVVAGSQYPSLDDLK